MLKEVKSKDSADKEKVVFVKKPNAKELADAQVASASVATKAINSGATTRLKMQDYLKEQGLWSDEQDKELEDIQKRISENVRKLAMGGIKLSTAKSIAINIRKDRLKQAELLSRRSELDQYTVESQADNARFDYLASVCIVDEEGKRLFSSLDEYKNKSTEPYVFDAASALFELISDTDKDWEKKLPENKFLLEHNFVNEELRFINKDKKLVDQDGRLINDKGRFINEAGEYVDKSGNRINEDGSPYVESPQPFLED
jgi:hypothetical protein